MDASLYSHFRSCALARCAGPDAVLLGEHTGRALDGSAVQEPPAAGGVPSPPAAHSTLYFSARDVLSFPGRKWRGNFEGEVVTDQFDHGFNGRLPGRRDQMTRGVLAEDRPAAYWITSSARWRSNGGIVSPSAFAVLRLITSSNLDGCSIGRSAGLAPFRILSIYVAARLYKSGKSAP